jgi:hypothetical protein
MRSFSERTRLQTLRDLSADAIEPGLRNRLWNVIHASYFSSPAWSADLNAFVDRLWDEYFKWPQDSIPHATVLQKIRDYYFHAEWNQVYDFIEFCASAFPESESNAGFTVKVNSVFTQELAPYRFLGQRLVRVASPEEFDAIEQALATVDLLEGVRERLHRAFDLLADRRTPNYEASIRESLEGLKALQGFLGESAPKFLRGMADAVESGLPCLGRSEKPPLIKRIWWGLSGRRNARREEAGFEDAKFALVVCSAFVNYTVGRAARADSELEDGVLRCAKAQA